MTADPGAERPAPAERQAPPTPTYQGSRFPWWLALVWIAFLIFGAVYTLRHFLPDLKAWLAR